MLVETDGNLLDDFRSYIQDGYYLAVMPIARVHIDALSAKRYPHGVTFYFPGLVDLKQLGIVPNDRDSKWHTEQVAALSGIDEEVLNRHPLVVFPYRFRWDEFRSTTNFRGHLEFIRTLSNHVDRTCLNVVRYCQCPIGVFDTLPGNAGTINSNHMMAGALLFNPEIHESRIIGGAVFTHIITLGLGLSIESVDNKHYPKQGEVGFIAEHALTLYKSLLEASDPTSCFIQALSLLEFLAFPDEYKKFVEVKKVIARYVAKDPSEYQRLLDRFFELTGKMDKKTGYIIGYRTRMVHLGERLEDIVQDPDDRKGLFLELEKYIKAALDHMIEHSAMDFEDYLGVREKLHPF
jgi:hypothetical protein